MCGGGGTAITLFETYSFSTPCGDFASGNRKISSQGLRIPHVLPPAGLHSAKAKGRLRGFLFAEGEGFGQELIRRRRSSLLLTTLARPVLLNRCPRSLSNPSPFLQKHSRRGLSSPASCFCGQSAVSTPQSSNHKDILACFRMVCRALDSRSHFLKSRQIGHKDRTFICPILIFASPWLSRYGHDISDETRRGL